MGRTAPDFAAPLCWPLLFLALSGALAAQDGANRKRVYYRIPMAVDLDREILSSMVLGVDRVGIGLDLTALEESKTTVREHAFSVLLGALASGDVQTLAAAAVRSSETEVDPALSAGTLANLFANSGATDLFLRAEYPLSDRVFVLSWSPAGAAADQNLFVTLGWDPVLAEMSWYPASGPPPIAYIAPLINLAENAAGRGAAVEVALEPGAFRFSASLGDGAASLHFNGKAYRWNVGQDDAPPGDVAALYKSAYSELLAAGPIGAAGSYTAESAADMREWGGSFREGELERFSRDLERQNRLVVFILDASPFYIVFYNTFSMGPGYDTIIRDPDTGELKLTAFHMSDDIDLLMKDDDHFWKPIISPIASRGADPDDQDSMPVTPAFLRVKESSSSARLDGGLTTTTPDSGPGRPQGKKAATEAERRSGGWVWIWGVLALVSVVFAVRAVNRSRR